MGAARLRLQARRYRPAPAPELQALGLSGTSFLADMAAGEEIAQITGKTAGSTLSISPNDGRVVFNPAQNRLLRGATAVSAGDIEITITETLPGATGSPRDNDFTLTVVPVDGATADFYVRDGGTGDGLSEGSPTTWEVAWAAASDGQTIKLVGDTTIPQAFLWNKSITAIADYGPWEYDPLGDSGGTMSFARAHPVKMILQPPVSTDAAVRVSSGKKITLAGGIKVDFPHWPGAGQIWNDIGCIRQLPLFRGLGSSTADKEFLGIEIAHGYGPDQEPYDPTFKYPEFNSPAKYSTSNGVVIEGTSYNGWGDPDSLGNYNTLWNGPQISEGRWRNVKVHDCDIHDIKECFKWATDPSGTVDIQRNRFQRIMGDSVRCVVEGGGFETERAQGLNNLFIDCGFAHEKDAGNPHADVFQSSVVLASPDPDNPLIVSYRGWNISNNVYMVSRPGVRSIAQFIFCPSSAGDHQKTTKLITQGSRIRQNVALGARKSYENDNNRDVYLRDNLFVVPTWYQMADGSTFPAAVHFRRRYYSSSGELLMDVGPTKNLLMNTVCETIIGDGPYVNVNSALTGSKGATIPHTEMFADPSEPASPIPPAEMYAKYLRIGPYAGMGPAFASLREHLTASTDFTGEPPFIGLVDPVPATEPGQLLTTPPALIHCGDDGDVVTFAVSPGQEVRQVEFDQTTVFTDWTDASEVDLTSGKYLQARAISPGYAETTPFQVSGGGFDFKWNAKTVSAVPYPVVQFNGSTLFRATSAGLGATGSLGTLFIPSFRKPSKPASTQRIFGIHTGSARVDVQILNTGRVRVTLRNASNVAFANIETPDICDNDPHDIAFSWDTTQAVNTDGRDVWVDWAQVSSTATTWAQNPINYGYTTGRPEIGGTQSAANLVCDLGGIWLHTSARLNLNDPAVAILLEADNMAVDPQAGTGIDPAVFITGVKSQWEASGGINLIAGKPKFELISGGLVDVSGSPWGS
jgi:hypothetical protein